MPNKKNAKQDKPPDAPNRAAPASPGARATPLWLHGLIVVALFAANLALYYRTVDVGFLSVDDPDYVQNNPYIDKLNAANLKQIFRAPYAANYAPANILSYAVDVALAGGKKAPVVHLSNVLWHGWVVCMVYLLACTIRPGMLPALTAALLFLVHPAHVEVVAWISSRKDLVATGFAVLSMACYLRYRRRAVGNRGEETVPPASAAQGAPPLATKLRGKKRRATTSKNLQPPDMAADKNVRAPGGWWYAASWLSFLLASAGKQSVLLLPAVMLVWDLLVEQRWRWTMLADKVPFGLCTIFFGWMTWHAQPGTNQALSAGVLAGTELANLWLLTGLGQYVLYRPAPQPATWHWVMRFAALLVAVGAWGIPLLLRKRQPRSAALGYWILLQMVPPMLLSFIVPITDRYLFLPSVGVCLLVTEAAAWISGLVPKASWSGWVLAGALGAVWTVKTSNYIDEWRDPRSVWYGAHLKTTSPQVAQFLAEIYHNAADRMDAFIKSGAAFPATNELKLAAAVLNDPPRVERLRAEWLASTGGSKTNSIAYREELWNLSWAEYEDALAHRGTLSAPNLFMGRGRLLVSRGKFQQAIPEFQIALRFAENSTYEVVRQESVIHALRSIGVAHWNMHDYKRAREWYLKAQAVQRKSGKVWISTLDEELERVTALVGARDR